MKRCCYCLKPRPRSVDAARKAGWNGVQVLGAGRPAHWACGDHRAQQPDGPLAALIEHAEAAADGKVSCQATGAPATGGTGTT